MCSTPEESLANDSRPESVSSRVLNPSPVYQRTSVHAKQTVHSGNLSTKCGLLHQSDLTSQFSVASAIKVGFSKDETRRMHGDVHTITATRPTSRMTGP